MCNLWMPNTRRGKGHGFVSVHPEPPELPGILVPPAAQVQREGLVLHERLSLRLYFFYTIFARFSMISIIRHNFNSNTAL